MGKYDNLFNSQKKSKESITPEEAVAAVAVVIAAADSSLEDVDAETVALILWEFEVFEEYSEDEISEIVDRLMGIAEGEGLGTLFHTAKESLSDELVLDAFAAGVLMVIDEDELIIPQNKTSLLKKLQQALDLEEEEAQEIIQEVIAAYEEADNEDYLEDEDETVVVDPNLEVYESPSGNFNVSIPVEAKQGGRVQSQEGVVGFSDDYGTLLRIDYYPLTSEEEEEIDSMGQEKYLGLILTERYVPQAISANVPDAKVEAHEYLEDIINGAYFVIVDMPKGSTISKQENNGNATRMDAYRGLLSFLNGEYLYIVSSQRSFFQDESRGSLKEETEKIKQKILAFVERIEFT